MSPILNFTKIRPIGAELRYAERQTDRQMTKLTGTFRHYAKAPINDYQKPLPDLLFLNELF